MSEKSPFVVSPEWLVKHLKEPGLSIVDASWYLPAQNRDARAEYNAAHIPGAVFFDQDAVIDPDNPLAARPALALGVRAACQFDGHRPRRHHHRL